MENPFHITLDSGATVSFIRKSYADKHKIPILPNNQLALLADDKTRMTSLGEIDIKLQRGSLEVRLKALVMEKLQADCFGGTTFHYENDVQAKIRSREIKVNKHTFPQTNEHLHLPEPSASLSTSVVKLPSHTFLHLNKLTTVLPNGIINIPFKDKRMPDQCTVAVQPTNNPAWPPQICPVIANSISYTNNTNTPLVGDKTTKFLCLPLTSENIKPNFSVPPPSLPSTSEPNYSQIILKNTNKDILNPCQLQRLAEIHTINSHAFNANLTDGYNGKSGKFQAALNFKSEQLPTSKQCPVPLYNHKCLALQQQLMDSLEQQGVLVDPQTHNIQVKKVSPSFILQKGRAKHKKLEECSLDDIRWVVAFNNLNDDLLPKPSKQTSGRNVLTFIAKHRFHIHADLYNSYFQIPVRKQDWQWLGVRTPFRGVRVLTRAGQGLLNSETELDELVSRILGNEILSGFCYVERDDIIVGGDTIDATIHNWNIVLTKLNDNNLKVAASKVKIFPKDIEVFGHRIIDGKVHPSDHILTSLGKSSIDQLNTVKQVNSWKGLYKTLLSSIPGLAHILDPFDKAVAGANSKDTFSWTPDLIASFNNAMSHLENINKLTLPHPSEQLILMPDGARTPGGIGWALFVQRKTGDKPYLLPVQFFSAKIKPYMSKWLPCEIEGVAASLAINATSHWILASTKPTYVTPDCKAVVEAVERMRKGKISRNPRLQTILISINRRPVTFIHSSAKTGQHVIPDYASRMDITCGSKDCAVERFLDEIPDNVQCMSMKSINDLFTPNYPCHIAATSTDNLISLSEGNHLPLGDKHVWKAIQESDIDISTVKELLTSGDSPRKNDSRMVKTIFRHASLHEGLVVVKESDNKLFKDFNRIVIPKEKIITILQMIHLKGNHPSQYQSDKVFSRYFFCPGFRQVLGTFYEQCFLCTSVKKNDHPKPPYRDPDPPDHPGTHFNIDVMKRNKQVILVCTDIFSKYVTAVLIPSETSKDLGDGIIRVVSPIRRSKDILVKSDAHPSLKSLKQTMATDFNESGIHLVIGDVLNKNSNCHVDKIIQELEYEIRKSHKDNHVLSNFDIANATFALNSKLRRHNLSSSEILFKRDNIKNCPINFSDLTFKEITRKEQKVQQEKENRSNYQHCNISPGMIVMLKENPGKHVRRIPFLVIDLENNMARIKKILNMDNDRVMKLSSIIHRVHVETIFEVKSVSNVQNTNKLSPNVSYPLSSWSPISQTHDSESDCESEDEYITTDYISCREQVDILSPSIDEVINVTDISMNMDNQEFDEIDNEESVNLGCKMKNRPKLKEKWITRKQILKHEKIAKLKETIAAVKIQTWYKQKLNKRINHRYCMKLRNRNQTPELLRSKSLNDLSDIVPSNDEAIRYIESDSKDTLDWDSSPECLELDNSIHQPLNLDFNVGSRDFMRVYKFDNALPITNKVYDFSSVLPISPQKTKKKSTFKYLKKFIHKKNKGKYNSK